MRTTTQILLLRHGQTDANATGVLQGHLPTPLNVLGLQQAALLAERLKSQRPPIEILISSDLPRAMQTASAISLACKLKIYQDRNWRERGFGLLEGKPVGKKETWLAASGEMDAPGAEPIAKVHARVREALLKLPIEYPKAKVIAVVTHGGPIRAILKMLSIGTITPTRGSKVEEVPAIINCSILQLQARHYRTGIKWRVSCVNDSAHLENSVSSKDSG